MSAINKISDTNQPVFPCRIYWGGTIAPRWSIQANWLSREELASLNATHWSPGIDGPDPEAPGDDIRRELTKNFTAQSAPVAVGGEETDEYANLRPEAAIEHEASQSPQVSAKADEARGETITVTRQQLIDTTRVMAGLVTSLMRPGIPGQLTNVQIIENLAADVFDGIRAVPFCAPASPQSEKGETPASAEVAPLSVPPAAETGRTASEVIAHTFVECPTTEHVIQAVAVLRAVARFRDEGLSIVGAYGIASERVRTLERENAQLRGRMADMQSLHQQAADAMNATLARTHEKLVEADKLAAVLDSDLEGMTKEFRNAAVERDHLKVQLSQAVSQRDEANGLLNEVVREQPIDIAMRRHIFNHLEKSAARLSQGKQEGGVTG